MPDARGGFGSDKHSAVMRAVAEAYKVKANRSDCNAFVKAVVATATGGAISFPSGANANQIFDIIKSKPWLVLGAGETGAKIAGVVAAHEGKLVVSAWKNPNPEDNGHCAIVLDFTNSKNPPKPDAERHIGELMRNRAVIAQGMKNHPENSSEYMKISLGYSSDKLKTTVYSSIDIG
jgi:hypothetical protein